MSGLKRGTIGWLAAHPRAHELSVPLLKLVRPGRPDLLPSRPPNQVEISGQGLRRFWMLDQGGRDQIVREILERGWAAYEHPLPQVLAACARSSRGLFIDVGANTGYYSLLAVSAGRRLSTAAFEPFPPAAAALTANLAINRIGFQRLGERVTLIERAAGATGGEAELWLPPDDHGLIETSSSLSRGFKEEHAGSITVKVIRLDEHPLPPGKPAIMKVDVEGLEHQVLEGAEAILARCRPLVFLEVLPQADVQALDRIRAGHRYTDVRLRRDGLIAGESIRPDPEAWNHLLVPAESADRWLPLVRSALA